MPIQQLNCGTMYTGESINRFRLATALHALEIHIKTNGRMRATRMATPKRCMEIVSEFTKRKYKRTDAKLAAQDARTFLTMGELV